MSNEIVDGIRAIAKGAVKMPEFAICKISAIDKDAHTCTATDNDGLVYEGVRLLAEVGAANYSASYPKEGSWGLVLVNLLAPHYLLAQLIELDGQFVKVGAGTVPAVLGTSLATDLSLLYSTLVQLNTSVTALDALLGAPQASNLSTVASNLSALQGNLAKLLSTKLLIE